MRSIRGGQRIARGKKEEWRRKALEFFTVHKTWNGEFLLKF